MVLRKERDSIFSLFIFFCLAFSFFFYSRCIPLTLNISSGAPRNEENEARSSLSRGKTQVSLVFLAVHRVNYSLNLAQVCVWVCGVGGEWVVSGKEWEGEFVFF